MNKKDLDALAGLYEGVYMDEAGMNMFSTPAMQAAQRNRNTSQAANFFTNRSSNPAKPAFDRAISQAKSNQDWKSARETSASNTAGAERIFKLKPGSLSQSSTKPTKPATTTSTANPAGTSSASKPGTPGSGSKVVPSAKPATSAKPAGSAMDQWAAANPKLAAAKAERDRTRGTSATTNPLMKDFKDRLPAPKSPSPTTSTTAFAKSTPALASSTPAVQSAGTAAAAKPTTNQTATAFSSPSLRPTPSTTPIRKPGAVMASFEWGSKATLKDVASLYSSIYEGKKKDQDQDGDNDFADVRIARMIASGMSKAEAIAAVRNKEYNEEFEYWVDSLVEEGYDLSDYTMDEMFDIYLDEAEGSYGATPKARAAMSKLAAARARKPASEYSQKGEKTRKVKAAEKQTKRQDMLSRGLSGGKKSSRPFGSRGKMDADERTERRSERAFDLETKYGEGSITKNPKKLRKQKAMGEFGEAYEIDEATRMRKELGKEGEIETRKELAARSKAYKRSGSVDKTIAAAERGADRPYIKYKRDESDADRKKREERQSRTLRGLAASRRGSVRDNPRAGMRGYAAKVEGSDKDLQSARQKAMSAGTLTPKEKKQLGEVYEIVASYLLENNFAATLNDANVIIENMSETWLEEILTERRK
jgi:hypothetical protein